MSKELIRLLQLSGLRAKNEIVTGLYENYFCESEYDAQGPLKGLEGPFKMKNGRVVYYDPKEGKYYDRRADMYLSDEEAAALREDAAYNVGVILHAKKGNEKLSLRLESMLGMRPAMTLLRNNGYQDFAYSDDVSDEPVDIEPEFGDEEEESLEDKLSKVQGDLEHLVSMAANGEPPEEVADQIVQAVDTISALHADLMGGDDVEGPDLEPVDHEEELECYNEGSKGRARDTKSTPSLSQGLNKRVKKALQSKERQQGREAARTDEGQNTYAGWKAAVKKKHGSDVEFEGDKDICQAFVKTDDGKRKGVGEWDGAQGELYEAAVNATVFDNDAMPANAVDDAEQKAERTGQADRTATKNVVPKKVMQALDQRIAELKKSIDRYDTKGYNEGGVKVNAIECLEQIKKNLSRGDHEGFMEAQIFFTTLMSPIWDMIPAQVVNYLAKGDDRLDPDSK